MWTPHKGTLWGELSRYFGEEMGDAGKNTGTGDKLPTIRHNTRNSETQSDRALQWASPSVVALLLRISCAMPTFGE